MENTVKPALERFVRWGAPPLRPQLALSSRLVSCASTLPFKKTRPLIPSTNHNWSKTQTAIVYYDVSHMN
jgi:hypothetical protein